MSIQESIEKSSIETLRDNFGNIASPPFRLFFAMVKAHPAKLSGVTKNECPFSLSQNEVVMFAWNKVGGFDAQCSCHSEVKTEPVVARELEEHALAARRRMQGFFAYQSLLKHARVHAAEDPFPRVQGNRNDPIAAAGVPLFAIPLYFGQLRHRADYATSLLRQQ